MFGGKKDDKPAPSGMEMMLRSMGMGPILDMGLQLVNDGTLAKIIAFAESADEILNTLRKVQHELEVRGQNGTPGSGTGVGSFEPCPHCGVGGNSGDDFRIARQLVDGMSVGGAGVRHGNAGGDSGDEPARPATDNGAASGA